MLQFSLELTKQGLTKVSNRNTRGKRYEICSKLSIKTPERRQWHRSSAFIVIFEHMSYFVLVILLLSLNMQLLARKLCQKI